MKKQCMEKSVSVVLMGMLSAATFADCLVANDYTPVEGGFEIRDGRAEFTRPLYGSHVADCAKNPRKNLVWAGDRPRVLLGRYHVQGNMPRLPADGILEFGRGLSNVTYRYVQGRAEYEFAGRGRVTLVRCADSEGLLAEVRGDVPHEASGQWRELATEKRGGAVYIHFGRPVEKPAVSPAAAFDAGKVRLAALSRVIRVRTPDDLFNSYVACTCVAADAAFEEGFVTHGNLGWRRVYAGWRGAYLPVTLARDDDFRTNARGYFAGQDENGRITCYPWRDDIYNMGEVFVDSVMLYWDRTGDEGFFRECAYEGVKRYLGWMENTMKVPGANLYENWLDTWCTDDKWCNGGAGTIATAYTYRAYETMARIAEKLGQKGDAVAFKAKAKAIRADAERLLFIPSDGVWCEYRERFGAKRPMRAPDLSTVYTAIDMGLASPERAESSLAWVERNVPSAFAADGSAIIYSSNRLPVFYTSCGLYPNEVLDFAHAYYLVGEPEAGWRHLRDAISLCARGDVAGPGVVGTLVSEGLRNKGHSDFGDILGVSLRLTVEGVFGIHMDAGAGRVKIMPGFPAAWDKAEIETPYLAYCWTRAGGVEVTKNQLNLRVEVKMPSPKLVGATLPKPHRNWGEPKGEGTDYVASEGAVARPVPLDAYFNRAWRTLHKGTFSQCLTNFPYSFVPRTVRENGRSWWEKPDSRCPDSDRGLNNVPARLNWPSGRAMRTASGLDFRLGEDERPNGVFVGLFKETPSKFIIPLSGRASKVAFLTALSTNPNQDWMEAARITVRYADGGDAALHLVPPDNCDDWLNYLQSKPYHLTGEHVMFGEKAHANVLTLKTDPNRELKCLELKCISSETLCGLLAVTLY